MRIKWDHKAEIEAWLRKNNLKRVPRSRSAAKRVSRRSDYSEMKRLKEKQRERIQRFKAKKIIEKMQERVPMNVISQLKLEEIKTRDHYIDGRKKGDTR